MRRYRKNRLFNNYKNCYGYKTEGKDRLEAFRIECKQAVETSKISYLVNLGNKANNPIIPKNHFGKLSTE